MNAGVMLWARSEWRRRWGSLALVATVIAITGGTTVAAVAAARRTETAFDRMLIETRDADLFVSAFGEASLGDLDPILLDRVIEIEGVAGATEIAFVGVALVGSRSFFSYAVLDERADAWRPIYVEGTPLDGMDDIAADEVLINEAMRDLLGEGVGSMLLLETVTAEQWIQGLTEGTDIESPAGPTMTARVVAVVRTAEDVSDAPDPFLIFSRAYYEAYADEVAMCRCTVLVNTDRGAPSSVAAELAVIYPDAEFIGPNDEDLHGRLSDTVGLQQRAWLLMAVTAAFAGAAILLLACRRFIRSVMTVDDRHRALGMTNYESQAGRFLILTPAVLIGALGAAGFAFALSPLAPVGITRRAEPDLGLRWDPTIGWFGVATVLVVALFVTGLNAVAIRARHQNRHPAWRSGGPVTSLGSRLALGPGRGAIVGLFLATFGSVGALTVDRSIDYALATPLLYGADYDAIVSVDFRDVRLVTAELVSDADIEAVAVQWGSPNQLPFEAIGPGGVADVEPGATEQVKGIVAAVATRGRAPLHADEVAVGRAIMDQLGAQIGDSLTATGRRGPLKFIIVGELLNPGVDSTSGGFELTLEGLTTLLEPDARYTAVRFAPHADDAAVILRHRDLNLEVKAPPSEVGNIGELGGLPARVAQLLALLGGAALISAIVATVANGRRQVAIHRALGCSNAQVIGAHLWQSAIVVLVGGTIGGIAGFVVGRAIHHELADSVGAIAQAVVPGELWAVEVVAILVALLAGLATSALALRRRAGSVLRAE